MQGLSNEEVTKQIKKNNTNKFDIKTSKTFGEIIFNNVFNLFNIINTIICMLLIFVGSYRNLLFMGVVISNILIGIIQEFRAKIIIDKLKILNVAKVDVVREDREIEINSFDVVLGDLINLHSSSQIPVDGIINNTEFLEVNESLITGESEPVEKTKGDFVYSGSFVISGVASITATAVGNNSFSGKLTLEAKKHKKFSSEIIFSLQKIIRILSYAIGPLGILLFLSQYFFSNQPWQDAIVSTAGGVIGMIPAGLILLISLAFAVSVIKLAKYKALISESFALEQLARIDTICFDKTGTITKGDLVVDKVIYKTKETKLIDKLLIDFISNSTDRNSTANALIEYFGKNEPFSCEFILPFSSARKLSAVSFNKDENYVLGAPEFMLNNIDNEINDYVKSGYRVICFAKYNGNLDNIKNEIIPLAFILISDKLRENLADVFMYFKKQNVDIKIISGDNPITVSTTAEKAGFSNSSNFLDMSLYKESTDYSEIVKENNIFGRVSPSQKKELILALKNNGNTVAMVGDGVNDIAALKAADCSIAMASGSDAVKGVANIVLLSSDLYLFPKIISEGRKLINNLQKAASLYLTKTIYTVIITLIYLIPGLVYPFQPIHFTLIGALFIGIPSFYLALDKNEEIVKKGFLGRVFKTCIPFSLLIVLNIVIVTFLIKFNFLTENQGVFSSISIIGFISFLLLTHLASPLNIYRKILCFSMLLIFVVTINIEQIFAIPRVDLKSFIVFAVLSVISITLLRMLKPLYKMLTNFIS